MEISTLRVTRTVVCLLLGILAEVSFGNEQQANEFYQQQRWQQAADAYADLANKDTKNFRAWFRLANAHIKLGNGQKALNASTRAAASPSIPKSYISYQQAQAYLLMDREVEMWDALDDAAADGFNNPAVVENNEIWAHVRQSEAFGKFLQAVDRNVNPCAHDAHFSQFDFWLGKWSVYGNVEKTGPLYGRNHVEKTQNGCLIMEHWTGSGGTTGTSMNYYDGRRGKWVQNWVSAGGTIIDYEGGLVNGSMVLLGTVHDILVARGARQTRDFRGTWTLLRKGVVRQLFEESSDGGATWTVGFDGYYFPEEN